MLHYSQPGSQARVDPKVASTTVVLGILLATQRNYLTEYLHLHPDTKVTVLKNKLPRDKAIQLTTPKVRQDPELQNEMAGKMKDLTINESHELTRKVKNGEVKKEVIIVLSRNNCRHDLWNVL